MQFNVNDGVVKMLELLASNKSLQAFIVILAIIIKSSDIISAMTGLIIQITKG